MSDWKAGDTAWVWLNGPPEKITIPPSGTPPWVSLHRTADACWQAHIDKLRQAELAAIETRREASKAYFAWRAQQGKDTNET